MKILITGISGLLGNAIAQKSFDNGHEVLGLARAKSKVSLNFPHQFIKLDLTEQKIPRDILEEVDAVIHCAADTTMGSFSNSQQDLINITAVENLIAACCEVRLRRFVFVSTSNTIYPGIEHKPGTERVKLKAASRRLNYVNSKINAERIILDAVQHQQLPAVIMNPTFILNPDYALKSSNKLIKYVLNNRLLFYPQGGKNIVDARDVADATVEAIEKGRNGENYLLSNQNISYNDFYRLVKEKQGKSYLSIPTPSFVLIFIATLSTLIEQILNRPLNFNLKSAGFLSTQHYYDNTKAKKAIDFQPRALKETVEGFTQKLPPET